MHPSELIGMNYHLTSSTPDIQFPFNFAPNLTFLQATTINQNLLNNNGLFPITQSPSPIYMSSNSTSDDSEEIHQMKIIDERRQRRMISNRESARRSRMRKQRHLDELWSQVIRLRNENNNLIDKLNNMSENHDKVLQENARLKEEASDLRQMISNMKLASPYIGFGDSNDDILRCTSAHIRAESSNQSISSSNDLLM